MRYVTLDRMPFATSLDLFRALTPLSTGENFSLAKTKFSQTLFQKSRHADGADRARLFTSRAFIGPRPTGTNSDTNRGAIGQREWPEIAECFRGSRESQNRLV